MRSSPLSSLLLTAAALALTMPLDAQAQVEGSVPVQQFLPTQAVPGAYNHVWGPSTLGHLRPSFGVWANYAARPLELQSYGNNPQQVDLVRAHLQLDVTASLGLGERFQLGVAMPVTPFITEGEATFATPPEIAGFGLGDLRVAGSWHILGDGTGFDLAAVALASVPTGDADRYLGNGGFTFEPKVVAAMNLGEAIDVAGNVGFLVRPETQELSFNGNPLITAGHELTYGLGGRYALADRGVDLMAELYGKVSISDQLDGSSIPLELDLSARSYLGESRSHAVTIGAGAGLIGGYGSPVVRVFAGYAFAPSPKVDTDGDGIFDKDDACVNEPEDFDEFEDADGCPDADNDSDGILDGDDKCPNKPEDKDDFEDEDGCPDPDNDGDGVNDADDRCPNGLTDPKHMEDKDGFKDDDGCLDPDNDRDGILDPDDQCPEEKETINGVDDEDGCPDEGESAVEVTDTHIVILQKVFFQTNSDVIKGESFAVLDQVALTLKANDQITLVEVEGHTDDVSAAEYNLDLSQRRADAVKSYLIGKGVEASRMVAKGYGESTPLVKGTSKKARAKNRRVEFRILEMGGLPDDGTGEAPQEMKGDEPPTASQAPAEAKGDVAQVASQAPAEAKGDVAQAAEPMAEAPIEVPTLSTSPFGGEKADFKVLVFFDGGSAELSGRGEKLCSGFADWMNEDSAVRVRLLGFTDATDDKKADVVLSQKRNDALKACLVAKGVSAKRIEMKAPGPKWPRQPNDSEAHRAENRRVRMLPIDAKGQPITAIPVELKVALPSF